MADLGTENEFGSFCTAIALPLGLDARLLTSDTGIFVDLELDSLQVVQLMIAIEEWADVMYLPEDPPDLDTIGKAFDYALRLRASEASWSDVLD